MALGKEAGNAQSSQEANKTDAKDPVGIFDMYQIVNRINVRTPAGAFVLSDDEKTLYYKNNISLPKEVGDEDTLKNAGLRIFDSVACVTDWIDVLMGLNDGDMEYEDCLKRLDEVIS